MYQLIDTIYRNESVSSKSSNSSSKPKNKQNNTSISELSSKIQIELDKLKDYMKFRSTNDPDEYHLESDLDPATKRVTPVSNSILTQNITHSVFQT